MTQILPIHEIFHTFQGEGQWMGSSAFFVRTFGCPVQCPWCDSAGTWHPNWVPKEIQRMSVEDIVKAVMVSFAPIVVVTGGEPAVHDLEFLVNALHALASVRVHLETSGGFPIKGDFDWVTLSPKKWGPPLKENVIVASEFKIIVEEKDDIRLYLDMLTTRGMTPKDTRPIWLHPEWSKREDPVVLGAIADAAKHGRGFLRAGWQLHKLYRVDSRDTRTQPLVPLGGDLRKGY